MFYSKNLFVRMFWDLFTGGGIHSTAIVQYQVVKSTIQDSSLVIGLKKGGLQDASTINSVNGVKIFKIPFAQVINIKTQ